MDYSKNSLLIFIESLGFEIYDWVIVFGLIFLTIEILHAIMESRMDKHSWKDTFNSVFTQIPLYLTQTLFYGFIVAAYFITYEYIPWKLPINRRTVWLTILATDFVYYVFHRLAHRVRLLRVAHSVHHSAQVMNTAAAFRFSILDPFISATLHFPLILLWFNPIFVTAGELLVQAYQFWIHNEIVPKLGFLEYIFITPSSHRVHHAREVRLRDANYGGIFIFWDILFGTFRKEETQLEYGLPKQIDTINPITVQFHEVPRLMADLKKASSWREKIGVLFWPPTWLETKEWVFHDTTKHKA